eukprot:764379-Hanusia_phi.AAC.1
MCAKGVDQRERKRLVGDFVAPGLSEQVSGNETGELCLQVRNPCGDRRDSFALIGQKGETTSRREGQERRAGVEGRRVELNSFNLELQLVGVEKRSKGRQVDVDHQSPMMQGLQARQRAINQTPITSCAIATTTSIITIFSLSNWLHLFLLSLSSPLAPSSPSSESSPSSS